MDSDLFFYRTAVFTRTNDKIALVDINEPQNQTPLDDWFGVIVSLADGKHTIRELISYLGKHYQQTPDNLAETLHSIVTRLVEGKILKLSSDAVELPYYLTLPIEQLDITKAKQLIEQDGYIH